MKPEHSGIARRDFLRACTLAGFGLACGSPHQGAESAGLRPYDANPSVGGIVVGVAIGASAVCAAVAECLPHGTIKILGTGYASAFSGTKPGSVESVAARVRAALVEAEIQSDVMIRRVVVVAAREGSWLEMGLPSAQEFGIEVERIMVAPQNFASALENPRYSCALGLVKLAAGIEA